MKVYSKLLNRTTEWCIFYKSDKLRLIILKYMLFSKRFSLLSMVGTLVLVCLWIQPTQAATSASTLVQISGMVAGDQFGRTQATGDLNGDGRQELIMAAPYATVDGTQAGAVYIIYGTKNSLSDQDN